MSTDPKDPLESPQKAVKLIDDSAAPKPASTRQALAKEFRHAGVYPVSNSAVFVCEKKSGYCAENKYPLPGSM